MKLFMVNMERPYYEDGLTNRFWGSGELDEKVACSILELTTPHIAIANKTQTTPTKFFFAAGSSKPGK